MAMNLEPELKFRLSRRKLASLANERISGTKMGPRAENDLVSTYYDTEKHKLRRYGLTLRVRRAGDEYVQTIKAARTGGFARSEWEEKIEGGAPDFRKTKKTPISSVTPRNRDANAARFQDVGPPRYSASPYRIERGGIGRGSRRCFRRPTQQPDRRVRTRTQAGAGGRSVPARVKLPAQDRRRTRSAIQIRSRVSAGG
jgi:hypothetical protein